MSIWFLVLGMMAHSTSCETVRTDQILGEDLARVVPAFSKMPGDAVIGLSPGPGVRRIFSFPELEHIGLQYGIAVADGTQACFEWRMQPITEDAVRAAIREALQMPQARVDVLALSRSMGPAGTLVFPLAGLSASSLVDPRTPVTWRGKVVYHSSRKFEVWARVRISTTTTRVVAKELLLPGQTVTAQQVRMETYDDFPLRNDISRNLEEVVGRVPRRAIRAGQPIFRADLMEPFLVKRGEAVTVTAISGAAQLEMDDAVAENQGRQGDMVYLRNPRSGQVFRARVEGKDRALVLVAGSTLARVQ
ncbi:MAG TPA: flagellar basal body P-ring formation chaperone FlgA [Bryobacteraceae bacterium]|nr:flagellar basal body P-ring formation chaperone FlgA [Bryobacteraceae bacterium]